jgi:hypothetical protein
VADTVIEAVHVHGNDTLIVIRPVDAQLGTTLTKKSNPDRQREPITIRVSFPCTCTASITVPITFTSTHTAVHAPVSVVCRR